MEKLHELSRTTVRRRRDPAHSRVLAKNAKSDILFPVPKLPVRRLIGTFPQLCVSAQTVSLERL
jgi:hypothetical protein